MQILKAKTEGWEASLRMLLLGTMLLVLIAPVAAQYGSISVSWANLPTTSFPNTLRNGFYECIIVEVRNVPPRAYAHVNSFNQCAALVNWECDVSEPGVMRLTIQGEFGYGSRFAGCNSPIQVEFGTIEDGENHVHHQFEFRVEGDHRLPKVRIGEVLAKADTVESGLMVYVYPQIEFIFPEGNDGRSWPKPHWQARIEGREIRSYVVEGWNDCNGPTTKRNARTPCKSEPLFLNPDSKFQGIIKVTFDPTVEFYVRSNERMNLEFESDTLSFWYDLVHKRQVPPPR